MSYELRKRGEKKGSHIDEVGDKECHEAGARHCKGARNNLRFTLVLQVIT